MLEFWTEWQGVISTAVGMIALGVGVRRLEVMMRHKKSEDRAAVFNRIGALELSVSSLRGDGQSTNDNFDRLRDGCKSMETRVDGSISEIREEVNQSVIMSAKAEQNGDTILALIGKKKA